MKTIAMPFAESQLGSCVIGGSLGLLFATAIFGPLMLAGNAPGDLGDARFNTFVLEHIFQFVTGRDASFASPGIFYPFPDTLFFSDTHVGSAAVYILLRALGLNDLSAFTGWFFIGYVTTYIAAYYALVKLLQRPLAAIAAAALFTFSLPSLAQISHAQLVYRCGVPLAMLYLWYGLRRGSVIDLVAAAAWLLVQMLINIYLGVFLTLLMGSFFAAYAIFDWRALCRDWFGRVRADVMHRLASPRIGDTVLAFTCLALLAATAALLFGYMHVAHLYGLQRSSGEISNGLPRLSSYFLMDGLAYWHHLLPAIGRPPMSHEHQLFVGLGVLALFAVGIWRWRSGCMADEDQRLFRPMLTALAILILLTLDIGGLFAFYSKVSLYTLIVWLPGLNAIRMVTRIILVLMFPIAYVAGNGLIGLLQESKHRTIGIAAAVFLCGFAAYEISAYDKSAFSIAVAEARTAAIADAARAQDKDIAEPILAMPFPLMSGDFDAIRQLDAMLAAQHLGWPTVNGYSGNSVPGMLEKPSCDIARVQYLAFEKWRRSHNVAISASVPDMLRRTVFVNGGCSH